MAKCCRNDSSSISALHPLNVTCHTEHNRSLLASFHIFTKTKGKEEYLYSAIYKLRISQSAQTWITQFYLLIHHACLSFVRVRQMVPPLTDVEDIQLQFTTHLSTQKGWKAELAWLGSSAGQRKYAGRRPTFYHWATQPIIVSLLTPKGIKGWDGLVGWPIADGLPT